MKIHMSVFGRVNNFNERIGGKSDGKTVGRFGEDMINDNGEQYS